MILSESGLLRLSGRRNGRRQRATKGLFAVPQEKEHG